MRTVFTKLNGIVKAFCNMSLNFKISSIFCIAFLFTFIFFCIYSYDSDKKTIEKLVVYSSQQICRRVCADFEKNIPIIIEDVIDINNEINRLNEASEEEVDSSFQYTLNNLYADITSKDSNFQLLHSIVIMDKGGRQYVYVKERNMAALQNPELEHIASQGGKAFYTWTGVQKASWLFKIPVSSREEDEEVVSYYTNAFGPYLRTSVSILNLSVSNLSRSLEKYKQLPSDQILIDCMDGTFIKTRNFEIELENDEKFNEALSKLYSGLPYIDYDKYILTSSSIVVNNWRVVMLSNKENAFGGKLRLLNNAIIYFTILLIFLIFMSFFITSMITKPLKKLTSIITDVKQDNLDVRFQKKYNDEVGILARAYNEMMDNIKALNEKVRENERQARITEIRLLQIQIKPHFLYNSMETLRFLVKKKDPKADEMIQSMSQFYKLSLKGYSGIISVGEEIELIRFYLSIQKIRYPSVIEYDFDIDPASVGVYIPKLTLQPIVENAVYHGLKQKHGKGRIHIEAGCGNDVATISITDNGIGMTEEQLQNLQYKLLNSQLDTEEEGIALINIERRLKYCFGDDYGLSIESEFGRYTKVIVRIPARIDGGAYETESIDR